MATFNDEIALSRRFCRRKSASMVDSRGSCERWCCRQAVARVQTLMWMGVHSVTACLAQTQPFDEGNGIISGKLRAGPTAHEDTSLNKSSTPTSRYRARCLYIGTIGEARRDLSQCDTSDAVLNEGSALESKTTQFTGDDHQGGACWTTPTPKRGETPGSVHWRNRATQRYLR